MTDLRGLLGLLCCALLVSCSSMEPAQTPPDAAEDPWFAAQYEQDDANQAVQERQEYLSWIQRFYNGMNRIPGWQFMSEQVVEKAPVDEQAEVSQRLNSLGRVIAAEWAKDNRVRLITTRMVNIWRQALEEAVSQEELLPYLEQVETDIERLLAERLPPEEIEFERYFIDEFAFL